MYFLSRGFLTHAKCRTAYQSQTPCTTTAVSDMVSYNVCQTSDLLRSLGDLSDREGYDFDQLFAIAKVQVCIFPRSLTVHMAWARRLHLRPSSRVFFTQLGSNSDRYTRIWPLCGNGAPWPVDFLESAILGMIHLSLKYPRISMRIGHSNYLDAGALVDIYHCVHCFRCIINVCMESTVLGNLAGSLDAAGIECNFMIKPDF